MSILNRGILNTIKTNIDTLLGRNTEARLAKLDKALQNDVWTNAKAGFIDAAISSISGAKSRSQEFLSSGTFNVPTNVTLVWVTLVGGGGGGGAGNSSSTDGGGGGAGGSIIEFPVKVTSGGNVTVTIGAGGASNSAGGTTSFGSISVPGGSAGQPGGGVAGSGGLGGGIWNTGGAINGGNASTLFKFYVGGGGGGNGNSGSGGRSLFLGGSGSQGGGGGGSFRGSGANAPTVGNTTGNSAAANSGAGGSGGSGGGSPGAGGSGGSGYCLVEWIG